MEFLKASVVLFFSGILLAIGGFVFWIVASQLMSTSDIGYATTTMSSIYVVSSITALGLEYTLLKRTVSDKGKAFGTLLIFELLVNISLIPIIFLISNPFDTNNIIPIFAALIFITNGIAFIPKATMLGRMKAGTVIVFDGIAFSGRFVTLVILALLDYGAVAILASLLVHSIILSIIFSISTIRHLGFTIGNLSYLKTVLREGLSNFPARLSRLIIMNLGILLFAHISIDPESVGIFYMALMISVVGSEASTSLSTMSLPASLNGGKKIILLGTRLSLLVAVPITVILLVSPSFILGLIGENYSRGADSLFILAFSIIPTALVLNALSKFNSEGKYQNALKMGIIEISIFLILFFPLVLSYSINGLSIAILLAYVSAAIFAGLKFGRSIVRILLVSYLAILCGYFAGIAIDDLFDFAPITIIVGIILSFSILLGLKATTITELKQISNLIMNRNDSSTQSSGGD